MLSVFHQLIRFMRVYRKFWMAPIIFGLIALGGFALRTTFAIFAFLIAGTFAGAALAAFFLGKQKRLGVGKTRRNSFGRRTGVPGIPIDGIRRGIDYAGNGQFSLFHAHERRQLFC